MKDVYIKTNDLNCWVAKHFTNQDLISVEELIGCIEELDDEVKNLKDKIKEMNDEFYGEKFEGKEYGE